MKKYKVAIIGNGGRATVYARTYAHHPEIEIVALADPDRESSMRMCTLADMKFDPAIYYAEWRDILDKVPDLDGVAIITPNHLHCENALPFIRKGLPIALEKPFSTTMDDAETVLTEAAKYRSRILLGFVLRSTPYYRKVHELVGANRIGRILTVQADELGSYGVTSTISRSPWRRHSQYSGGTMMEKSSHDVDLMNWLIGARPVSVNSYGGSLMFRPNPLLPLKCSECPHQDCHYRNPEFNPNAGDAVLALFMREAADHCIYNIDKDVFDNQSLNIEYSNGTLVNFMLSFNCAGPRSGRNIHIVGTRGRLWGNIDENEIFVYDNFTKETEKIVPPKGEGGHNGGDVSHALELLKMMKDPAYQPAQDAYAGYLSGAVCIAGDLSAAERKRINFRYHANGFITFDNQ